MENWIQKSSKLVRENIGQALISLNVTNRQTMEDTQQNKETWVACR